MRHGRFVVQVFDQGEPGGSRGEITGDSFAIELIGGAYAAYTRGGYIEGGNVQVREVVTQGHGGAVSASALDHEHRGLGRHAGVGVEYPKLVDDPVRPARHRR